MDLERLVGHPILASEYVQHAQMIILSDPSKSVLIHPLTFISFSHRFGSSPWDPIAELTELLEWRIQNRLKRYDREFDE